MNMIAWYMRDFEPSCAIAEDELSIKGLRFLSEDLKALSSEYIYFGNAAGFFSDAGYSRAYIAVHKKNYLLFMNSDYEALLNCLLGAFDYFNDWERRMIEVTARQGRMQEIFDIAWEVFENPAVVGDLTETFYAASGALEKQNEPYWDYMMQNRRLHPQVAALQFNNMQGAPIIDLTEKPVLVENIYKGGPPVLMMYLVKDDQPLACCSILQTHKEWIQLNMQLAPAVSGYLLLCEEFTAAKPLIRSDEAVFKALLEGENISDEKNSRELDRISKRLGQENFRLVIFRQTIKGTRIQKRLLLNRIRETSEFILPVDLGSDVYALLPEDASGRIKAFIISNTFLDGICLGVSMVLTDLTSVPSGRRQAEFALGKSEGQPGAFFCEDHAFSYLIEQLSETGAAEDFIHPALSVLEAYDKRKNMQLTRTLSAYLDCRRSIEETSKYMNIHKSTLKYRIKRIEELTDIDFDDPAEMRYLALSIWLKEKDQPGPC